MSESKTRLSRKQKRELGLLPRQVLHGIKELKSEGEITSDMTTREMAFVYAATISDTTEYGGPWGQVADGTYGVDWDGLLEFIERLLELLMKFFPLFMA